MSFARLCVRFCAVTLLSLAGISSSRAAFLVGDSFTYPNGPLAGSNGGTGWGGAWASGGGTATVVNNALRLSGDNNNIAFRTLSGSGISAANASTSSIFISFLLTPIQGNVGTTTPNNAFLGLWFGPVVAADHTDVPNFGLKTNQGSTNDLFARESTTGQQYAPGTNVVDGRSYLLVAQLISNGSQYTTMRFGVNPTSLASLATVTVGTSTLSSITSIGFRTSSLGTRTQQIDDLRITTSFNEAIGIATPAPPAILLALGGLPFLGLAARRAARRKQEVAAV